MENINKNIKHLRNALNAIKLIKTKDYILESEMGAQGFSFSFNDRLTEAQFQLEVILNDLEEKYHKIHKIGGYHD
jgi:hypothetical protein